MKSERWKELKTKFLSNLTQFPLELCNLNNLAGDKINICCDDFAKLKILTIKKQYVEKFTEGCPTSLIALIPNGTTSDTTKEDESTNLLTNGSPCKALLTAVAEDREFIPASPDRDLAVDDEIDPSLDDDDVLDLRKEYVVIEKNVVFGRDSWRKFSDDAIRTDEQVRIEYEQFLYKKGYNELDGENASELIRAIQIDYSNNPNRQFYSTVAEHFVRHGNPHLLCYDFHDSRMDRWHNILLDLLLGCTTPAVCETLLNVLLVERKIATKELLDCRTDSPRPFCGGGLHDISAIWNCLRPCERGNRLFKQILAVLEEQDLITNQSVGHHFLITLFEEFLKMYWPPATFTRWSSDDLVVRSTTSYNVLKKLFEDPEKYLHRAAKITRDLEFYLGKLNYRVNVTDGFACRVEDRQVMRNRMRDLIEKLNPIVAARILAS